MTHSPLSNLPHSSGVRKQTIQVAALLKSLKVCVRTGISHWHSFQVQAIGTLGCRLFHTQRSPKVVWFPIRHLEFYSQFSQSRCNLPFNVNFFFFFFIIAVLLTTQSTFSLYRIFRQADGEHKIICRRKGFVNPLLTLFTRAFSFLITFFFFLLSVFNFLFWNNFKLIGKLNSAKILTYLYPDSQIVNI